VHDRPHNTVPHRHDLIPPDPKACRDHLSAAEMKRN